jgi:methyltransferase (TIGR00027 family)
MTAYWIAAARARESARPDRLFVDPWAHALAGERGYATMAASEQVSGSQNRFIPVRVRWFDDTITALARAGVRQVVLLGAGLDTRAFRLDLPSDLDWYELDRTLPDKEALLAGQAPRCRRHVVTADLARDDEWPRSLADAGFDPHAATAWVAEGLLYYLDRPTIVALLNRTRRMSGPGSRLLADLMPASAVARANEPAVRARRERAGMPPPFGDDDPEALFGAGGWSIERLSVPGAPDANFGRLPAVSPGRHPGAAHLVTAHLTDLEPS